MVLFFIFSYGQVHMPHTFWLWAFRSKPGGLNRQHPWKQTPHVPLSHTAIAAGFNTTQTHPAQEARSFPHEILQKPLWLLRASAEKCPPHMLILSPWGWSAETAPLLGRVAVRESLPTLPRTLLLCQNPLFQLLWVFKALSFIPLINELYYFTHFKTALEGLKHWLNMKEQLYQHWHSKILMHFYNCMQQFTASTELWLQIRIKQQRKTSGSFILKTTPEQS